ncbi:hypothetical protein [Luteimonas aestuarii]|uniref:rhamnosyltransferase WsaF family glycosyltransferase n=1 Tax=Luteimonas aestuarii TaxID=453837 RepID=UPI001404EA73|nr:hypothetical protein [Luteimonas aestuarii]
MMRSTLIRALRWAAARLDGPAASTQVPTSIAEIVPCHARVSERGGPRLNLLLPSINSRHYFGGIHTAVVLYREMLERFPRSRIILTDAAPEADALLGFPDHRMVSLEDDDPVPRQIVAFNDRYARTLPVSADDLWLSTAWWTAYAAQQLSAWQQAAYGTCGKSCYLIQDFEPGFYPWSSQSYVALGTYRPEHDIAVFNTSQLSDYFDHCGIGFRDRFVFEPTLNDGLRRALSSLSEAPSARRRQILVYGRPSTPRNAFELICESLRIWAATMPDAAEWEVVSAGELREDVDLGGVRIRALGKLHIDAYGELLSTSAVGLSLMVSPHPSYPPLEMAAFGMGVVTNPFHNKDMGGVFPGLKSATEMSPVGIAAALVAECQAALARNLRPYSIADAAHAFVNGEGIAAVAPGLATAMLGR